LSASSQPVPFNWKQVDERLSSIMLGKVSAEIRELITDDVGHIRFQNTHNGNSMAVPSERLQMHRLRTDEWAARLYEGYCEIWQTQRRHLSPEFLRGIATHAIGMLVSARKGSVADEFSREQRRTGNPDVGWLQPAMDEFARAMARLLNKWEQTCEFDARTVQYMLESAREGSAIKRAAWEVVTARARIRTLEAAVASLEARIEMAERALNGMLIPETPAYRKASVEQSLSRLKDQRKELRASLDDWLVRLKAALRDAEEIETSAIGISSAAAPDAKESRVVWPRSKKGKRTPGHRQRSKGARVGPYRSEWKRATKSLLIEDPKMSTLQICRELDDSATKIPKKWIVGENRSFENAYKQGPSLRQRIHTAISKIRNDLRNAGVID
jgi:hypothetical protein